MLTMFQGEQKHGRIKYTTDRDCLAPDIFRLSERVFPSMEHVFSEAHMLERRGYQVCIDTETVFYETETA